MLVFRYGTGMDPGVTLLLLSNSNLTTVTPSLTSTTAFAEPLPAGKVIVKSSVRRSLVSNVENSRMRPVTVEMTSPYSSPRRISNW